MSYVSGEASFYGDVWASQAFRQADRDGCVQLKYTPIYQVQHLLTSVSNLTQIDTVYSDDSTVLRIVESVSDSIRNHRVSIRDLNRS